MLLPLASLGLNGLCSPFNRSPYNVLPFAAPPDLGPGLRVTARTLASGPVEDLALTFSGWAGALHLSVDGHPDLYTPAQVSDLCDRLIRGLDLALRDPDAPLPPLLREHA
ncbi:hypothetical protein Dcae01_01894 [Deinococcus caeni]|uniref:Condensation domain-containing protein n=1 Tax=Deinococcus caeni TaxID=569127 RepID=A0ABP9UC87_9DEIO